MINISVPAGPIFSYCKKWFDKGFGPREEFFKRIPSNLAPAPLRVADDTLGYVTYPDVSLPGTPKGAQATGTSKKRGKTPERKSINRFFKNAIVEFDVVVRSTDRALNFEKTLDAAEFVAKVLYPLMRADAPSTILIDGKIGCGKTTLIGAATYAVGNDPLPTEVRSAVVLRVDLREGLSGFVETMIRDSVGNTEAFIASLEEQLLRLISARLREVSIPIPPQPNSYEEILAICDLESVSPVFVFDELDTLYYSFCLASVEVYQTDARQLSVFRHYQRMIGYFFNLASKKLVSGFASPVVVIAARSSTIKLVEDAASPLNLAQQRQHFPETVVSLARPDNSRVQQILQNWSAHFLGELRRKKGDYRQVENLTASVTTLKSGNSDFSRNLKLSVHGLRHITKVLGKSTLEDPTLTLFSRYVSMPGLLRLYQYLDGCQFYSQTAEGVANVFLVNNQFEAPEETRNPHFPSKFKLPHLQTYWLKYFFLKVLVDTYVEKLAVAEADGVAGPKGVDARELIDLFVSDHKRTPDGCLHYERELLELIVVHATEVVHGRLIKLASNRTGSRMRIIPSERAIEFSRSDLFWEFGYLSICIEDDWLEFPIAVQEFFAIDAQWQRTFNFCTTHQAASVEKKRRFLLYKAERVLDFVALLEIALNSELIRYKSVFEQVSEFVTGLRLNDYVPQKREKVIKSIAEFGGEYVEKGCEDDCEKHCRAYLSSEEHSKFRKLVQVSFEKYDRRRGSCRSMHTHMRHHHLSRKLGGA